MPSISAFDLVQHLPQGNPVRLFDVRRAQGQVTWSTSGPHEQHKMPPAM